ncbi:10699_t:CDS:2 [Funneliformis geosporum]|uniref:10699_t:CDS:1 n=1 Tax=Funneliformis geosporum TaxID=1117311 RepID=A0A9W4WTH3_9GLOM|nr:10699_t:CDS:2 [Funneliformis geosporum]
MTKLCLLEIGNTDIDSGLEYLPISLREFDCMSAERKEAKVNLIAEELRKLGEIGENEKEKKVGEITEKQRDNLKEQVRQLQKKLEDLQIKENRIEILPENS